MSFTSWRYASGTFVTIDTERIQFILMTISVLTLSPCLRPTQDPAIDTLRLEYLLGPCVVLALIFNYRLYFNFFQVSAHLLRPNDGYRHHSSVMEILWTFSIYLEALAILPQLFMLQRTGEAEMITTHYLFALGAYRALYIPNWVYRYVSKLCSSIELVANDWSSAQLFHGGYCRSDSDSGWISTDGPVLWFLLHLLHEVSPIHLPPWTNC